MTRNVVVDSDSIFALYNPNDSLNAKATNTFQRLIAHNFQLVYPTSVIFEIVSLFQRVLPTPTVAYKLIDMVKHDALLLHIVDTDILKESAMLFDPAGTKKNTLIDCSVVVVAKKIKAEAVFSYDSFYTKQGLKLAEEVVKEEIK